ncbi:N-formylglutamate deformylase [Kiloniella antarctica]|uniref:N-formylglutamate deformylase n=1 Tax=Kiloniella antarctica TaxID=1550907 RepID=A0ABW5BLH0_9PROT
MSNLNHTWSYTEADSPIVMSVPHSGRELSDVVKQKLTGSALSLVDTDWHMDTIVMEAAQTQASVLVAHYSRYMVDLNRPQDDKPLYAGATTGLVPSIDFDGNQLYLSGQGPDKRNVQLRVNEYWIGYHQKLRQIIDDTRNKFGFCLLLDCHSIRSKVPRLFDGTLPDINIGTNEGATAANRLSERINDVCEQSKYSYVFNGRFKGGYITRHYGQPMEDVHAVQIEIAQHTYMLETAPWTMLPAKVTYLTAFVGKIVGEMLGFAEELHTQGKVIK